MDVPTDNPLAENQARSYFISTVLGLEYRKFKFKIIIIYQLFPFRKCTIIYIYINRVIGKSIFIYVIRRITL